MWIKGGRWWYIWTENEADRYDAMHGIGLGMCIREDHGFNEAYVSREASEGAGFAAGMDSMQCNAMRYR